MKIGDHVRDKANLGGVIEALSDDRAKVRWNSGEVGWLRKRWLTVEAGVTTQ